jgi:transposase
VKLSPLASEPLTASQIADLRLAASKMQGAERRAFQAEMALKYCQGSPRLTETILGWGRENVTLGLAEKRTGISCVGAHSVPQSDGVISRCDLKADSILYYPSYHSKYNPIERCWGILEKHWNGAKLINVETMLRGTLGVFIGSIVYSVSARNIIDLIGNKMATLLQGSHKGNKVKTKALYVAYFSYYR